MKKQERPNFADYMVQRRKIKEAFFNQINLLVDWRLVSNVINKHYQKGESVAGRPSYDGLVLFKMGLLQTWYGLSDYEVEDRVNDSISFSRFVGISLEDPVPDHSVLSRFRTELTQKGVYEKLFKVLNKQLDKHKILIKTGIIVDASIVDSPLKPKGNAPYELEEETKEQETERAQENSPRLLKAEKPSVDTDARWVKKTGKLRYGYKKHFVTDTEGLVLGVLTTAANVHEISNLEQVLNTTTLPPKAHVNADKGYASQKNQEILAQKDLRNRILSKAKKNKPLTQREKLRNKLISKTRFKIERTFGSIKRWFNSTCARYRGIEKMHTQNLMEAMAYNLYRSPARIGPMPLKTQK